MCAYMECGANKPHKYLTNTRMLYVMCVVWAHFVPGMPGMRKCLFHWIGMEQTAFKSIIFTHTCCYLD